MRFLMLLFSINCLTFTHAQNPLFPITEKGLKGFINAEGTVIIEPKFKTIKSFSEGLAAARLPCGLYGFIDEKGEWKIPPQYDFALGFSEGLAVVFKDSKAFCINKNEKKAFILENVDEMASFKNGVTSVKIGKDLGVINKFGQWIIEPKYKILYRNSDSIVEFTAIDKKHVFFYFNKDGKELVLTKNEIKDLRERLNVADRIKGTLKGDNLIYKQEILTLKSDKNKVFYCDRNNKIVWQTPQLKMELSTIDVDHMNDYGYHPQSRANAEYIRLGGYHYDGKSDKITNSIDVSNNKFVFEIKTNDTVHFKRRSQSPYQEYLGFKLYIANNSKDTFLFDAYDGRIDMTMQAMDKSGEWRDINAYQPSRCGNSLHVMVLDPKQYWQFDLPLFKGSFKTKLRLKLMKKVDIIRNYWVIIDNKKMERQASIPLYSNEIEGSINPAQFWRKLLSRDFSLIQHDVDWFYGID
jgi:hypothetical protein